MTWTAEQILSLAPDASVAKDGQSLAAARKWVTLATLASHEEAAWGEIKGSGKTPYQTQIDLSGPAFKCSCPSHKRPCKHAVGLFLLYASQAALFVVAEPPEWVAAYLANRAKHAQQTKKVVTDSDSQVERAAERLAKVNAGLADLELWLRDIVRGGLASLPEQPQKFWRDMAARLIDAQAPGLARMVTDLSGLPASGEGWQERLLEHLAQLHLLIESFGRLDTLPVGTQADVRALIGWTQTKADVAEVEAVEDTWVVVGKRIINEEALRVQRTWLWGKQSQRPALLLDYAVPGQTFETNLIPGLAMPAQLTFFPSNYPLRALIRQAEPPIPITSLSGTPTIDSAVAAYAQALACNPWLDLFPMLLAGVIPLQTEAGWQVHDAANQVLPIAARFDKGWTLLALSGGEPLTVFGEWGGEVLLPLGAWAGKKFVSL